MNDGKNIPTVNPNSNINQRKLTQKAIKSIKEEINLQNTKKIRIISAKDELHQKITKLPPNTNHPLKMKKYLTSVNDNLCQPKQISLNYNENKSESNIKTKNNLKNYGSANLISSQKTFVSSKEKKCLKKYITINNTNNNIKEIPDQRCNKKLYKNSFIKTKNYTSMQCMRSPKISRMSNFILNSVANTDHTNSNININSNNSNVSNNKHNTLANHKNKNLGHSNPNFNSINCNNSNEGQSNINNKNRILLQQSSRERQKLSTSNNRKLNQSNSKSKHKKNVKPKIKNINDSNNSVNNYPINNKAKISQNSNNIFKNYINNSTLVNNSNNNHLKSNKNNKEDIIFLDKNKENYNKIKEKIRNDYELELELENNINEINYTMGNLSSNDFALCNTNSNLETIYEKLMKLCAEKGLTLTKIDTNKYICKKDGDNSIKIEINTKGRTNVLKLYYLNGKEAITKEIIRQIVLTIGF